MSSDINSSKSEADKSPTDMPELGLTNDHFVATPSSSEETSKLISLSQKKRLKYDKKNIIETAIGSTVALVSVPLALYVEFNNTVENKHPALVLGAVAIAGIGLAFDGERRVYSSFKNEQTLSNLEN